MAETKYGKYFLTEPELRDKAKNPAIVAPSAVVESERHFGSQANFSGSWRHITRPTLFDQIPHAHDFDQFLCFFGSNPENIFEFDAECELVLGQEQEKHIINKATVVFLPKGTYHSPCTFTRVGKPVFFQPIALTPAYYTRVSEHRKRVQADSRKADIRKEFQGKMNEARLQIEALEEEKARIDQKLQEVDAKLNSLWNEYMRIG